jgi:hypothetical protein
VELNNEGNKDGGIHAKNQNKTQCASTTQKKEECRTERKHRTTGIYKSITEQQSRQQTAKNKGERKGKRIGGEGGS